MPRKKNTRMGRPTVLTPRVTKQICVYVERGVPPTRAAIMAGISVSSYKRFMRNEDFWTAIKKAEGRLMNRLLGLILLSATGHVDAESGKPVYRGNWTAAAWLLERRWAEDFGRIDRHLIKAEAEVTKQPSEAYVEAIARALGYSGDLKELARVGPSPDYTLQLDAISSLPQLPQPPNGDVQP